MKIFNKLRLNSRGFGHVELITGMAAIAIIAVAGIYVSKNNNSHAAAAFTYEQLGTINFGDALLSNVQVAACRQPITFLGKKVQNINAVFALNPVQTSGSSNYQVQMYGTGHAADTDTTNGWIGGKVASLTFTIDPKVVNYVTFGAAWLGGTGAHPWAQLPTGNAMVASTIGLCNP